jgi:hypothetical protein
MEKGAMHMQTHKDFVKLAFLLGYKKAADELKADPTRNAGVGTYRENQYPAGRSGSYAGQLGANASNPPFRRATVWSPDFKHVAGTEVPASDVPVRQDSLKSIRRDQAVANASEFFEPGTAAHAAMTSNLEGAGAQNQYNFETGGKVIPRTAPDLEGIGRYIKPWMLGPLLKMQNSMAQAKPSPARVSNA